MGSYLTIKAIIIDIFLAQFHGVVNFAFGKEAGKEE
jgi:hypothetical protein